MSDCGGGVAPAFSGWRQGNRPMFRVPQAWTPGGRLPWRWAAVAFALSVLSACAGSSPGDWFGGGNPPPTGPQPGAPTIGAGNVKVGLLLPLSAGGNAGIAAVSMRNAAELALAEFNVTDLSLIVKDD